LLALFDTVRLKDYFKQQKGDARGRTKTPDKLKEALEALQTSEATVRKQAGAMTEMCL
jgi:hypothetical protein